MAMSLTGTKVLALCLLSGVSVIFGILPWLFSGYLRRNDGYKQRMVLSALLCFGGGVLLATSMLHLLTEVREHFEVSGVDLDEKPVPEILVFAGFFMIYLIEELVLFFVGERAHHDVRKKSLSHSISCPEDDTALISNKPDNETSQLRDFLTFLALSFHAIFEGMGVGLEGHADDVWLLFAGIAAHKYVICFCFGLELVNKGVKLPLYCAYIITFSLITAVGGGIGIAILNSDGEGKGYHITVATFLALSAGTLLYVTIFEILARERSKPGMNGLLQFFAALLGFVAMMCVDLFAGHHHGDEDHDDHGDHDGEETTTAESAVKMLVNTGILQKLKSQ